MLYLLSPSSEDLGTLKPLEFLGASDVERTEKHLENLLATHLLDVLYEGERLMPIFQENLGQPEADLYALKSDGDLVIFELKRGLAGEDAVLQAIGYSQRAGRWPYSKLNDRYQVYLRNRGRDQSELRDAHRDAFQLDSPLDHTNFNRRQHLYVVGNAANDALIDAIEYWQTRGLLVHFLPYRIYRIGVAVYFEFFAYPYDRHRNPADVKGVLFDTNSSYDKDAVWEMMEKKRVAAYGEAQHVVEFLNPRDIIFFYHKGVGLVAAGEVSEGQVRRDGNDEQYRDVRLLTAPPNRQEGLKKAMTAAEVTKATGRNFFWARTMKVPYLDSKDAQTLVDELNRVLSGEPLA
jgi:hypothetical protein